MNRRIWLRLSYTSKRGGETIGGDGSETGSVTKKGRLKSTTGIGVSLIPDFRLKMRATTTVSTSGFTDYTLDGIV